MSRGEALADCSTAAIHAAHAAAGDTVVRVRGGSMRPLLPDGAVVRLRPLADGEPRVGDIVAALDGPRLIVHRVVAIEASCVVTHGDRTSAPDPPLPRSAVVGVATRIRGPLGLWLPAPHGARIGSIVRSIERGMRMLAGLRKAGRA